MKDKIDRNVNNVRFVVDDTEEEGEGLVDGCTVNVNYNRKASDTEEMVIDTACPKSMVPKDWLMKYLEENGLEMNDLTRRKCKQEFRFGPSRTYISEEIVTLPITLKERNKDSG